MQVEKCKVALQPPKASKKDKKAKKGGNEGATEAPKAGGEKKDKAAKKSEKESKKADKKAKKDEKKGAAPAADSPTDGARKVDACAEGDLGNDDYEMYMQIYALNKDDWSGDEGGAEGPGTGDGPMPGEADDVSHPLTLFFNAFF